MILESLARLLMMTVIVVMVVMIHDDYALLCATIMEINYWTNGKICAKVVFHRYTESVKFRSQSRERASKRKPYRGLGTR